MNRDIKGRFAVKLNLYRKFCLSVILFSLFIILFSFFAERYAPRTLVYKATPKAFAEEIDTIDEMKETVLDTLAKCESGGDPDVAIIFDTNGVASVGEYQWQPHSFQHYYFKKHGVKLTEKEAVLKSLDRDEARALAAYVGFETDKGFGSDWVNCTKWHDLDTLVSFIKNHE